MVGPRRASRDQRHMAVVQRAHRRHQRDALAPLRAGPRWRASASAFTDDLHRFTASDRGPGKRGPLAARRHRNDQVVRGYAHDVAAPHLIIFANEKGGTGKSTTAVHVAVALAAQGGEVAAHRSRPRQRTLGRYLENRAADRKRRLGHRPADAASSTCSTATSVESTRGADRAARRRTPISSSSTRRAATIPSRGSRDVRRHAGHADQRQLRRSRPDRRRSMPRPIKVRRPSFYAELVWDSRNRAPRPHGASDRLGRAAQPHAAYRGAQHAPRRRGA